MKRFDERMCSICRLLVRIVLNCSVVRGVRRRTDIPQTVGFLDNLDDHSSAWIAKRAAASRTCLDPAESRDYGSPTAPCTLSALHAEPNHRQVRRRRAMAVYMIQASYTSDA